MADFITNCGFVPTLGGTTDWVFSLAVSGYQSPANAQAVNGATYVVRAQSADLTQWEYAAGAYNSGTGTFARTTVLYNSSGTGTKQGGAGTKINFASVPQIVAVVAVAEELLQAHTINPNVRLTLTSGTPITTADVTAATNLYVTPYNGNVIPLYDGAIWVPVKFSEVTLSLSGLTIGTNYDVWGRVSAGALAVDTTAWTNDTARATAIAQQDGIDVKSGDATRRLLGTFRIIGTTGQTEDSHSKRFVSNRYNAEPRAMYATDPASTWNYSTAVIRQANANTANQIDYVACVSRPVWAHAQASVGCATSANSNVGVGIDSASGNSAQLVQIANMNANQVVGTTATYTGFPGAGRHFITWLEYGFGSGTQTFFGTSTNNQISGIIGEIAN